MKRIFIILACIFAANCVFQVSAGKKYLVNIYYGIKVTPVVEGEIPCKLEHNEECYRTITVIEDQDDSVIANSIVTEIGMNVDGVIDYRNTYTVLESAESIMQKILINNPPNVETTIITQ